MYVCMCVYKGRMATSIFQHQRQDIIMWLAGFPQHFAQSAFVAFVVVQHSKWFARIFFRCWWKGGTDSEARYFFSSLDEFYSDFFGCEDERYKFKKYEAKEKLGSRNLLVKIKISLNGAYLLNLYRNQKSQNEIHLMNWKNILLYRPCHLFIILQQTNLE